MDYKTDGAKIQFAKMARQDAEHDIPILTSEFKNNTNILNSFNTGLPHNSGDTHNTEWAVLESVINGFKNKINTEIPDVTVDSQQPANFDVIIPDTEFKINYTAVSFTIKSDTNVKANIEPATSDVGKNFCSNTGICNNVNGTNQAIFIVDFNQHGFLAELKNGVNDPNNDYTIHFVTTPEVINDPAPKPSVHDKTLFSDSVNGITLKSYIQTSLDGCVYSSYEDDIIDVNNNFFSTLDFTLSPIQQVFEKKTSRLVTNLNIKQFGQTPIEVNDSKSGNSNANIFNKLKSIIAKIGNKSSTTQLNFDFNVNCQRKRGGDWWQALCCHDIYNRTFTQILPILGTGENANTTFDRKIPVYFVTHDKIAGAYALMMGCNVVFLDWYGRVIVLKNTTDPANITDGSISNEESIFIKLKTLSDSFSSLLTIINEYQSVRDSVIQNADSELNTSITTCTAAFEKINNTTYQPIINGVVLKDVFRAAVKLEFTRQSLIDVSNDLTFINDNQGILTGDYNADNNDKLLKLNRTYYRLLSIKNQIIKFTTDGADMSGALNAWMECIKKQNVYKVINDLFGSEEDQENNTFDIRLLNVSNQQPVLVDKHIFLPYIQNLSPGNKDKINGLLNLLVPISISYNNTLETTSTFFRRGNRVPATKLFFNKVANFIVECRHFVYVVEPNREIIVPIVSDSTDVIIVGEDFNDITNLKNNLISIDPGTNESTNEDKIVVNCAVETKQVTSSLLTGLITNNYLTNIKMKTRGFFKTSSKGGTIGVENESLPALRDSIEMTTEDIDSIKGLESSELNPFDDVNFGYHPLLPIYMILSSFWNSLEPKLVDSCYYYRYANYYTMLEKMVTEITTNYLDDPKNNSKIVSAYLIGFSLKSFFFTSDHYPDIFGKFKEKVFLGDNDNYMTMSLLNSSFSNTMSGNIIESQHEQDFTLQLLNSQLIMDFFTNLDITKIVSVYDIIITDDMDVINKQKVLEMLNNDIYNLLGRIVTKINLDRKGNDIQFVPVVNEPIITKPSLERSTTSVSESGSEGSRSPISDSENSIGNQESLLSSGKDNTGYSSSEESTDVNSVSQTQSQFQPQSQFESQPIISTYDEKEEGSTTPMTDDDSNVKGPIAKKQKTGVSDNKMEIGGKKYTKKTNKGKSTRKTKKHK
jgi:hypothetical protein